MFHQDGKWDFRPHPKASEDDLYMAREFVDFVSFSLGHKEHLKEFRNFQDESDVKKMDRWRRENLKLVYSASGSK